jgi:hypothetical protein
MRPIACPLTCFSYSEARFRLLTDAQFPNAGETPLKQVTIALFVWIYDLPPSSPSSKKFSSSQTLQRAISRRRHRPPFRSYRARQTRPDHLFLLNLFSPKKYKEPAKRDKKTEVPTRFPEKNPKASKTSIPTKEKLKSDESNKKQL